jgi:RNA polymerase sigma-70 factor (ECF subfamily)
MTEYYPYLYGYIASRISSLADTEDILQETYLAAVISRAALSDETKLKAWLRGIADNKIKQHYRRQAIYRTRHTGEAWEDADEALPVPDTAADRLTAEAALARLQEEVSRLPEMFRNCAVVSLMCGLSGADAAEILGIPVQTVYNRVHKTKQILREKLEDIMEISLETFAALLDDGKNQVERTCGYLRTFYDLNDGQKYDDIAALLLTAPVFAADSPMAHYIIMQYCTMAMRVMRAPDADTLKPALKRLGESEFRLAEKLGLRGILDDDT